MTLAQTDILKKASKLFNNYGTRSVTMSDIANELGISKKTLYQYITDKEALIDMVLESEYSHMEEALQVTKQISHPIKQFIEIQNAIISNLLNQSGVIGFGLKKYYPDKYKYYFDKYVSLVKKIIDQNLSKGIESGIYRENLNTKLILNTHVMSFLHGDENSLFSIQDYLTDTYFTESLRYHLRAIVSKKHLDTIDKYLATIKPVLS